MTTPYQLVGTPNLLKVSPGQVPPRMGLPKPDLKVRSPEINPAIKCDAWGLDHDIQEDKRKALPQKIPGPH
ncbi:hypothetical protein DSO57_1032008 [Entomophthora muscae]|uniref:Uncharacterized protein n=1 Tax=Entomophthora muscae TaxID=34485 RepID=A0ACC2TNK1_9FUNG|nr:hypothetical protein DSO57_1032008 [Entomophthora muscae]